MPMNDAPEREPAAIPERRVLAVIAGLALLCALCVLVAWLMLPSGATRWSPPQVFAGPELETAPVAGHAAFLARQRADLAGAGGRMPIDRAMAQIAARGEDAFAPVGERP
ncbi:hypothetical protein [Pontibaca methylaminivorans]|uniref:Uncharacterized protein n=1 Tax=Pontibaca methylaminivorans TaxID=515897 RepID=A0A1R3X6V9_9RHOB|nr:hypothetical protein [Pontibaca methylaminivorans]SIT86627.1 hypothetical protein SAMN05421849_2346 [Pontibaca methylaminivorans]